MSEKKFPCQGQQKCEIFKKYVAYVNEGIEPNVFDEKELIHLRANHLNVYNDFVSNKLIDTCLKYDELNVNMERAKKHIRAEITKRENLLAEIDSLKNEINNYKKIISELKEQENKEWENKHNILQNNYDILLKENVSLKDQINKLEEEKNMETTSENSDITKCDYITEIDGCLFSCCEYAKIGKNRCLIHYNK